MIRASIHRPNLGSLAYVWIGDHEHVCATTSDAMHLLMRRGNPVQVSRVADGSGSVTEFVIEPRTTSDS